MQPAAAKPVVPDVRMFRAPAASGQDVFQYSLNRVSGTDMVMMGRGRGRGSGRGSVLATLGG